MFSSLFKINYCVNHIAINDSISVDLVFCGNWCGAKFDKMVVNYNEHAFEFRQDDYCSGVTIYIKSIAMITDYFKVHNVRLTTKQIIDDLYDAINKLKVKKNTECSGFYLVEDWAFNIFSAMLLSMPQINDSIILDELHNYKL